MRNIDEDTVTQAVIASHAQAPDTRLRDVMTALVQHLHGFAREVRLTEDERARSRVLLVDADRRVIAASDGQGVLRDRIDLPAGQEAGSLFAPDGTLVAFHHTPGYETYRGLGWYGVIQQRP